MIPSVCSILKNQTLHVGFSLYSGSDAELFPFSTTQQMSCVGFPWPIHCTFGPAFKGWVATATSAWMPGAPQFGLPPRQDLFPPPAEHQTLNWCSMYNPYTPQHTQLPGISPTDPNTNQRGGMETFFM